MNKKSIVALLLVIVMSFGLCSCGGSQESGTQSELSKYVEVDGTQYELSEVVDMVITNGLKFDNTFTDKEIILVGELTEINGEVNYLGVYMTSYVKVSENWIIDTSGYEDVLLEMNVGDMVKVTGTVLCGNGEDIWVFQVNDHDVTIEPYE